jgi:hypothetical protein
MNQGKSVQIGNPLKSNLQKNHIHSFPGRKPPDHQISFCSTIQTRKTYDRPYGDKSVKEK